jgi:hypothetical protein
MVHWEWEELGSSPSAVSRAFIEDPSSRLDYATFLFSRDRCISRRQEAIRGGAQVQKFVILDAWQHCFQLISSLYVAP